LQRFKRDREYQIKASGFFASALKAKGGRYCGHTQFDDFCVGGLGDRLTKKGQTLAARGGRMLAPDCEPVYRNHDSSLRRYFPQAVEPD
jgi:hypothetical protein